MKYHLTDAAVRDVREIVRHIRISQNSPQNAKLVATRLMKQFRALSKMPTLGSVREELEDQTARVLHVSGVLVIYDPTVNPLTILRVIHAARDLGRIKIR